MGSQAGYIEREMKFEADVRFELPDLRQIVGGTIRLPEQHLRTIYFDTPDLRLWDRRLTLRHRRGEGGDDGTWTLKLPEASQGSTLERTELTWPGPPEHIPEAASSLLRGIIGRVPLGRVLELESVRQRLVLHTPKKTPLGEIDDDTVTVTSGSTRGTVFRQIELEFGVDRSAMKPQRAVVQAVVKAIRKAGARPDRQEKFAKSLGLGAAPSGTPHLPKGGRHPSMREVVEYSMSLGLARLLEHDIHLRLAPADPPARAVHQARVATRRLRSDLTTFGPLLDPVWLDHTKAELKWLGDVLGQVRDVDVLTGRLSGTTGRSATEAAGLEELATRLAQQRHILSRELGEALDGQRYGRLVERLRAGAHHPPFSGSGGPRRGKSPAADAPAQRVLPGLVHGQWKRLRRTVHHAGHHPSDGQLHRIRIRAKQLRYAAEVATPALGKGTRRTARRAADLQTLLGEHHDAVAAEAWLRREAERSTAAASFVAGRLTAEERQIQSELEKQWRPIWRKVKKAAS